MGIALEATNTFRLTDQEAIKRGIQFIFEGAGPRGKDIVLTKGFEPVVGCLALLDGKIIGTVVHRNQEKRTFGHGYSDLEPPSPNP